MTAAGTTVDLRDSVTAGLDVPVSAGLDVPVDSVTSGLDVPVLIVELILDAPVPGAPCRTCSRTRLMKWGVGFRDEGLGRCDPQPYTLQLTPKTLHPTPSARMGRIHFLNLLC